MNIKGNNMRKLVIICMFILFCANAKDIKKKIEKIGTIDKIEYLSAGDNFKTVLHIRKWSGLVCLRDATYVISGTRSIKMRSSAYLHTSTTGKQFISWDGSKYKHVIN